MRDDAKLFPSPPTPLPPGERGGKTLRALLLLVLFLVPVSMRAAGTVTFGDIQVTVGKSVGGSSSHGYAEYSIKVYNLSKERPHTVQLSIPSGDHYGSGGYIRSVSRTVQIGPSAAATVPLAHPITPAVAGSGLRVIIDDREQRDSVSLDVVSGERWASRGYYSKRSGMVNQPLLLVSKRIGENFKTSFEDPRLGAPGAPATRSLIPADIVRSEEPISTWSPRWLAYSRFDGVVVTPRELAEAEKAVRTALFQYVEAGGVLLVLGPEAVPLPVSWGATTKGEDGALFIRGGFGACVTFKDADTLNWPDDVRNEVTLLLPQSREPFQDDTPVRGAAFLESAGPPVLALLALLLLFTIAIGPVNLWLLSRWKRRIWLLWTVPALSLFTCAAVLGTVVVGEGWQGRSRVSAFTLLDEGEKRATTLAISAVYSPLTPSDGLRFETDTEITAGNVGSDMAGEIDWTQNQHFRRGWVAARVPSVFQQRRSMQECTLGLPMNRAADGTISVTNNLGVPITRVFLADEHGQIHSGGSVTFDKPTNLTPIGTHTKDEKDRPWRNLFTSRNWSQLGDSVAAAPQKYLVPRSYLVEVESSPFLKAGLAGAAEKPTPSYILGLMGRE
jgi:hypothetical protein